MSMYVGGQSATEIKTYFEKSSRWAIHAAENISNDLADRNPDIVAVVTTHMYLELQPQVTILYIYTKA